MAVDLTGETTDGRRIVPFAAGHQFFFNNEASIANPATDLVTLRGSATRDVIFQGMKLVINSPADAATLNYQFLMRRSGIGTGGTQTVPFAIVNLDQSEDMATASAFGWTVSPSPVGTLLGVVDMEPNAGTGAVAPQDPHAARSILTVPFVLPTGIAGISLNGVNDVIAAGFSLPVTKASPVSVFAVVYWAEII